MTRLSEGYVVRIQQENQPSQQRAPHGQTDTANEEEHGHTAYEIIEELPVQRMDTEDVFADNGYVVNNILYDVGMIREGAEGREAEEDIRIPDGHPALFGSDRFTDCVPGTCRGGIPTCAETGVLRNERPEQD